MEVVSVIAVCVFGRFNDFQEGCMPALNSVTGIDSYSTSEVCYTLKMPERAPRINRPRSWVEADLSTAWGNYNGWILETRRASYRRYSICIPETSSKESLRGGGRKIRRVGCLRGRDTRAKLNMGGNSTYSQVGRRCQSRVRYRKYLRSVSKRGSNRNYWRAYCCSVWNCRGNRRYARVY